MAESSNALRIKHAFIANLPDLGNRHIWASNHSERLHGCTANLKAVGQQVTSASRQQLARSWTLWSHAVSAQLMLALRRAPCRRFLHCKRCPVIRFHCLALVWPTQHRTLASRSTYWSTERAPSAESDLVGSGPDFAFRLPATSALPGASDSFSSSLAGSASLHRGQIGALKTLENDH